MIIYGTSIASLFIFNKYICSCVRILIFFFIDEWWACDGGRAAAFTKVGKYEEAIGDCYEAIKLNPQYVVAYYRLGCAYYEQGKNLDAIREGFLKGSSVFHAFNVHSLILRVVLHLSLSLYIYMCVCMWLTWSFLICKLYDVVLELEPNNEDAIVCLQVYVCACLFNVQIYNLRN